MSNHNEERVPFQFVDRSKGEPGDRQPSLIRPTLHLGLIVFVVFLGLFVLLERSLPFEQQYFYLLATLFVLVLFFQRYHNCYRVNACPTRADLILRKTLAWVFTFLFTTLVVTLTELRSVPRSFLFSVVLTSYMLDLLICATNYDAKSSAGGYNVADDDRVEAGRYEISLKKIAIGFSLLMGSSIAAMMIKSMSLQLYSHYEQLFAVIIASWIISVGLTRAYGTEQHRNIYYRIAPVIKLGVAMALFAGAFYWYGQLEYISRGVLFGSISIFTALQLLFAFVTGRGSSVVEHAACRRAAAGIGVATADSELSSPGKTKRFHLDKYLPKQVVLDGRRELKKMLRKMLPSVDRKDISILFSAEKECIRNAGTDKQVLINLHGLNYIENLNQYMRTIRQHLAQGGYFVTWAYPLDTTYARLRASMPKSVFVFVYPLHFILFRVVPKVPVLGSIYFYFTKGCHPNISKVEVLGRLVYNGFSIVGSREINHKLYVVARANRPILDVEPSFGPVAKLNRIGYQGQRITVYKFRTMHPYSEFIQEDIYNSNCEIDERSKFVNDYRITFWGSILRKYWIDELPQLYNWLKGDIGWVGVRALSDHKFSLYPSEMQQLRIQTKPGLIPPLYADLPENFEEILSSEKRYLEQWSKQPLITDVKYFCRAMYNILIKGARSS